MKTSSTEPIVSLVDVRKVYVMGQHGGGLFGRRRGGQGPEQPVTVHALTGVSVDFYPGEYVAIMGASGSGKSTMLNLLGCLDRPSSGKYILGGRDVAQLDDDELSEVRSRYIGFIFQSYNLIQQYTVTENIQRIKGVARSPRKCNAGPRNSRGWLDLPSGSITAPPSFPAVNNSAWRLRGR